MQECLDAVAWPFWVARRYGQAEMNFAVFPEMRADSGRDRHICSRFSGCAEPHREWAIAGARSLSVYIRRQPRFSTQFRSLTTLCALPALAAVARASYFGLPIVIAVVSSGYLRSASPWRPLAILTSAGVFGYLLYWIFPAMGPLYLAGANFPNAPKLVRHACADAPTSDHGAGFGATQCNAVVAHGMGAPSVVWLPAVLTHCAWILAGLCCVNCCGNSRNWRTLSC